jgi:hypothetical protein
MRHDEGLIRAFVEPQRRSRYLEKLEKDRKWVTGRLDHFRDLDMRFATLIPKAEQTPGAIHRLLASKGAPTTCYVLGSKLDGEIMDLREALERLDPHSQGFMLSCLAGRLGYFQDEEVGERYVLERLPAEALSEDHRG